MLTMMTMMMMMMNFQCKAIQFKDLNATQIADHRQGPAADIRRDGFLHAFGTGALS